MVYNQHHKLAEAN